MKLNKLKKIMPMVVIVMILLTPIFVYAGDPESLKCEDITNLDTYNIIRDVFGWIQIAAPIMLLVFGVLDFGKAIAASDSDAMKKAQGSFVKRAIIVAIIILVPIIFDVIFNLADFELCWE